MPNTKAAAKQMRAGEKRRLRNISAKSQLKTLVKKYRSQVKEKPSEEARKTLQLLTRRIDQAVTRRIIHRNTASRRKSRLARLLS